MRPVPVARCLEIMHEHKLHHVRFNKRKTMRIKGEHRPPHEQFKKLEVTMRTRLCIKPVALSSRMPASTMG